MEKIEPLYLKKKNSNYVNIFLENKIKNFACVYNHEKYLKLNENNIVTIKFQSGKNVWLNTYEINTIDNKLTNSSIKYFDLQSPYGYYGPYTNNIEKTFIEDANFAFDNWCLENNIVAEFVRFNPLINNFNLRKKCELLFDRMTLSNDLVKFKKKIIPFNSKIMNQINNYKNHNIVIKKSINQDDYFNFIEIYKQKMQSISANNFYLFSETYFINLFEFLKKNGFLILAFNDKKIVGGSIILIDNKSAYYHLSANADKQISGLTNSLIYKAMQYSSSTNLSNFFLGGGNSSSEHDNLYKFKEKMANKKHKYYIGKKIHNIDMYQYIIKNWENKFPNLKKMYNKHLLKYNNKV